MKSLTRNQKKIVKEICEVQLRTSNHIFQEEHLSLKIPENHNLDIEHEKFFNNLLDTTNFFKKLKNKPELIFEIGVTHARIVIHILRYLIKDKQYSKAEVTGFLSLL